MNYAALVARLQMFRQQHVLRFWDELRPDQRESLAEQIAEVDFHLLEQSRRESQTNEDSPAQRAARALSPANLIRVPTTPAEHEAHSRAVTVGLELLRSGKVGVILVAGGQGTRLDFPHPKGMFSIGIAGESLFQLLAEQLVERARQAEVAIPYYVMTSDATHDETVTCFQSQNYFGLNAADVKFFRQGNLPAVDARTGRLLLAEKDSLALSPDGHGGLLAALARSGLLDDMRRRGVETLFYHQVDNPLARVCDPAFLGFHKLHGADVTTKVVAKLSPEEKMGVVVDVDGLSQIIEYSDLPPDLTTKRDATGGNLFWAGNTAIHCFERTFLDRLLEEPLELPLHRALKTIPFLDDAGTLNKPATENALKFERFIFDVLPYARKALTVEARREEEFYPLKNKTGEFSPDLVKEQLQRLKQSQ